jgi:hypothetical protein
MKFNEVSNKPIRLLAMTGYTREEFTALLPYFEQALNQSNVTLEGKIRQRKARPYTNSPLPSNEDKLFFILVYFKQYTTQTMIGATFQLSQPKANLWIHFLSPLLQKALSLAGVTPARAMDKPPETPSTLFSHDGTEREIQRPKDKETQKVYYSGKKKRHTVKNNVLANERCEVIF